MDEQQTAKKAKPGKRTITKRPRENAERTHLYGGFDFETTGLDGEVVFGTLQCELSAGGDRTEVYSVWGVDAMFDRLVELNKARMRWFAHNMQYDAYFLLHECQRRIDTGEVLKVDLFERGMGNFYKISITLAEGPKLEIYDSMALFGFSLDKFLKSFSTVGEKHKLDFEKESFDVNNPEHVAYAEQDTRGLLDAMVNFDRAFYELYGVHLKGTISATALAAWEVTLKEDDRFKKLSDPQSDFARKAYFGGLVFITSGETHTDIVSLDVNSMYPHCMRMFGVPVGVPGFSKSFVTGKPGIYHAIFTAPANLDFGCVGFRDKKGIAWPRGTFESHAFDFEITRAQRWGYIVDIKSGLIFDSVEYPFNDFVDNCEKNRAEHKGTPFEIVVKLAQNSVYGKFGTKTEGGECALFNDSDEIPDGWYPYIDEKTGGSVFPGLMKRDTERDTYYMLPHWAGYITAKARSELLDIVEAAGGAAIYGDTDSVKMPRAVYEDLQKRGLISVGAGYGQLKVDEEYQHFRAIAPKVYAYVSRGTFAGKGKGIPEKKRTADFWQAVYNGETPTVEFKTLQSLNSALKSGGKRQLKDAHRTSTDLVNSESWYSEPTGRIRAVIIKKGKREKQ